MTIPYEYLGAVTLYSAAVADTDGVPIDCEGMATVVVQISGTLANSTTVYFEGTVDETNWVSVLGWNINTGIKAASTTAAGIFVIEVTGLSQFQARLDWKTGASSVTAYAKATSIPATTLVTAA